MKESEFQGKLILEIKRRSLGKALVYKNTSWYQGVPDLTVLYGPFWAMLECKGSANAKHQPNQDFYIETFNEIGFARFIYPENKDEVLEALFEYFSRRNNDV